MSTSAGWADRAALQRGPHGFFLCRQCGQETRSARRTFCDQKCVHDWKLKSNPGYLRRQVWHRDHGICAICEVDAVRLQHSYRDAKYKDALPLVGRELEQALKLRDRWWRSLAEQNRPQDAAALRAKLLGFDPDSLTWWQNDHIIPVVEGGGECGLENCRTLCTRCHKRVTSELAARRAAVRKLATQ